MTKTAVVTARLDQDTADALQAFAAKRDRSRAWVLNQAVSRYLAEEAELDSFIEQGRRDIREGRFLTHEQMMEEIGRWRATRSTRP